MTLTQLETFVTLIGCQSFTEAARHLAVSQSAVSHALTALESELGVVLIERDRQQFHTTEIGGLVVEHCQEILRLRERIEQEAASVRGLQKGQLTIGSFGQSASIELLPPMLARLARRHPNIEVKILEGAGIEITEWLRQRQVDVGFVLLPADDEAFETVAIASDQLVVLLPEQHALAAAARITLSELAAEPFILSAAGSGPLIEKVFADAGVIPNIRYRIQQINSIIKFVEHGLGVSIVAELAVPMNLSRVLVRPLHPRVERRIGLAMRRKNPTPAAKTFLRLNRGTE